MVSLLAMMRAMASGMDGSRIGIGIGRGGKIERGDREQKQKKRGMECIRKERKKERKHYGRRLAKGRGIHWFWFWLWL